MKKLLLLVVLLAVGCTTGPRRLDYQSVISEEVESPVFYEVINNEVAIIDQKKNIRQLKVSSYLLDKNFAKQGDYVLMADCQNRQISCGPQGTPQKWVAVPDEKNSFGAVGFNRACGDHGSYMKVQTKGVQ